MLRAGSILLTLWAGFHLAAALAILGLLAAGDRSAPALAVLFGSTAGSGIEPRALATINYLAVLCNGWRAAAGLLMLVLVWGPLARGARWALGALAASALLVESATFLADRRLPCGDLLGTAATAAVAAAGLALAAAGGRRGPAGH